MNEDTLEGLVACGGSTYAALLAQTLPAWSTILDKICVVHPPRDEATITACRGIQNVVAVETDRFFLSKSAFNKGAGLNVGYRYLESLHEDSPSAPRSPGRKIVQFDADVLPPSDLRQVIDARCMFGKLYGCRRVKGDGAIEIRDRAAGVYGFFMVWYANDPLVNKESPFTEHFPHAGGYDFEFRSRWPEEDQELLEGVTMTHLGVPYQHWFGAEVPGGIHPKLSRDKMTALRHKQYKTSPTDLLPIPQRS